MAIHPLVLQRHWESQQITHVSGIHPLGNLKSLWQVFYYLLICFCVETDGYCHL